MLPYQAVAMDYTGYQRQQHHHQATGVGMPPSAAGHMGHMAGALGIAGPSPFGHSWLMPTQDMCGTSPYGKQMPGQGHPGATGVGGVGVPGSMQQTQDPGHVNVIFLNCLMLDIDNVLIGV